MVWKKYAYMAAAVIALATSFLARCTCIPWDVQRGRRVLYGFDALLKPTLSLIVAVTLIQDYVLRLWFQPFRVAISCFRF